MYEDLDDEMLNAHVRGVRQRYAGLNLTDDQARKILSFEQQDRFWSMGKDSFSEWEYADYGLDEFSRFLNKDQLRQLEIDTKENTRAHEENIQEHDAQQAGEVALNEEYTHWLRETFLPELRKEAIHVPIVFHIEREKVVYLRSEHKNYLAVSRANALVRHYRFSRRFEPNKLRQVLLSQEQMALMPPYERFAETADHAVRAVGAFLVEKYSGFAENATDFFRQKKETIDKQYEEMRMRHLGERKIGGWHTTIKPKNTLTQAQAGLMSLMLMEQR